MLYYREGKEGGIEGGVEGGVDRRREGGGREVRWRISPVNPKPSPDPTLGYGSHSLDLSQDGSLDAFCRNMKMGTVPWAPQS